MFTERYGELCRCVDCRNIKSCTECKIGKKLNLCAAYEELGLSPEEIKLMMNPPEEIWLIDGEYANEPVYRVIPVDGEELEICGRFNWNCTDENSDYHEIPVAGLDIEYFLTKEDAEKALRDSKQN